MTRSYFPFTNPATDPLNHRLGDGKLLAQLADCARDLMVLGEGFERFAAPFASAAQSGLLR